jgi:MFS family permease
VFRRVLNPHIELIIRIANPSLSAFGSSVYTPAIPDVMHDFNVSDTIATVPPTTYVLGLSFGPMIGAPISETVGSMGTYRIAVPISAFFTLGAGFAPNITALCVLRFFAWLFGGAPLPVCAGTSADLFRPKEYAVAGTLLLYTGFLGQSLVNITDGRLRLTLSRTRIWTSRRRFCDST